MKSDIIKKMCLEKNHSVITALNNIKQASERNGKHMCHKSAIIVPLNLNYGMSILKIRNPYFCDSFLLSIKKTSYVANLTNARQYM